MKKWMMMFIAVAMLGAITVGCSSTPEAAPGTTTGTDGEKKEGGEASKEGMSNTEEGAPAAGTEGAPAAGTEGAPAAGTEGAPAAGTEGAPAAGTEGAPAAGTEGAPAADGGADAEKGGH